MDDLTNEEVEAVTKAMEDAPDAEPSSSTATATANPKSREPSDQPSIAKAQFMQLEELAEVAELPPKEIARMHDIRVHVEVILGKTKLPLEQVLKLHPGSVVELHKLAGEPVDLVANGKLIARAEVVVIEDNFGVKILDIAGTKQKLQVAQKGS